MLTTKLLKGKEGQSEHEHSIVQILENIRLRKRV